MKKKKFFLVFDSNILLAKRSMNFLGKKKNTFLFSYENPFKIIFSIFFTLLIKLRTNKITIIVSGFRLPDMLILRVANLLNITSIYLQHGIFLTHLNRDSLMRNSKFWPYFCYYLFLSFLLISPFKTFNLYKKGTSGNFPYPTYALIYNKYWSEFHRNLLGWNKTRNLLVGIFDLSRNKINSEGKVL